MKSSGITRVEWATVHVVVVVPDGKFTQSICQSVVVCRRKPFYVFYMLHFFIEYASYCYCTIKQAIQMAKKLRLLPYFLLCKSYKSLDFLSSRYNIPYITHYKQEGKLWKWAMIDTQANKHYF